MVGYGLNCHQYASFYDNSEGLRMTVETKDYLSPSCLQWHKYQSYCCVNKNIIFFSLVWLRINANENGLSPGGYSNFSCIRRLGPSIYRSPQKISEISSTPKKYLKFLQPKKISRFCILTLRKDPKIHRNTP